jgi:hypothetical protein
LSLLAMRRALGFWYQRRADGSARFPKLLPIALRILSIPLGVGAVERSFNQTRTQQAVRRLNQSHDNREYEAYLVHNRRFLKKTLALVQSVRKGNDVVTLFFFFLRAQTAVVSFFLFPSSAFSSSSLGPAGRQKFLS